MFTQYLSRFYARLVANVDGPLLLITCLLMGAGLATVFSATYDTGNRAISQGLNMGLGLALGDVSALVSTGASVLTGLAYSRNHEREADCYAIALMRQAALPTAPMGRLLLAIAKDEADDEEDEKGARKKEDKAGQNSAATTAGEPVASSPEPSRGRKTKEEEAPHPVWSLLSSHPDTVARAGELERGHAPHCPNN